MKNTDNHNACHPQQEVAHVYLAMLLACVIPSAIFTCYAPHISMFIGALIVMLVHAALFGVPFYLFLKRFNRMSWFNCLFGGLVIGLTPTFILSMATGGMYDLQKILPALAWAGGLGATGGIIGWSVLQSELACPEQEND